MPQTRESLKEYVEQLRDAYRRNDKNPEDLKVRLVLLPQRDGNGQVDLDATLSQIAPWADAGVTTLEIHPRMFCEGPGEIDALFSAIASSRQKI